MAESRRVGMVVKRIGNLHGNEEVRWWTAILIGG